MPTDTFFNLHAEKQEKVMRTAISVFLNQGYEKGNIGDIAKKAGVAKGSMYQYFENKKELFLYSVRWSTELIADKFNRPSLTVDMPVTIFDYFMQSSKVTWAQLKEEREIIIFLEDVFMGKYNSVSDESFAYMMKFSNHYVLQLIRDGKESGHIRKDMDDHILSLFLTGASMKMKEYLIQKARSAGSDIVDEWFDEVYEREMRSLIELLINGMGVK